WCGTMVGCMCWAGMPAAAKMMCGHRRTASAGELRVMRIGPLVNDIRRFRTKGGFMCWAGSTCLAIE
ncbi:MAG: hypothetical protein ACR2N8_02470, partial [Parvibaculales bacterium]